jgi:hypothetical protein
VLRPARATGVVNDSAAPDTPAGRGRPPRALEQRELCVAAGRIALDVRSDQQDAMPVEPELAGLQRDERAGEESRRRPPARARARPAARRWRASARRGGPARRSVRAPSARRWASSG